MSRLTAKIVHASSIIALVLYATSGAGLLGRQAAAANHALSDKALNRFMNVGERYFQVHPLYQPSIPPPLAQVPPMVKP